jgi:dipeptidyl aminopeptidase/acylaminoacyl peptidase
VLLVHGDADDAVPVGWTRQLAAELADADLLTYAGADHMSVRDAARLDVVARLSPRWVDLADE